MKNKYGNVGVIDSGINRKIASKEIRRLQETLKNSKLDIELLLQYEKLYNAAVLERNAYLDSSKEIKESGKAR